MVNNKFINLTIKNDTDEIINGRLDVTRTDDIFNSFDQEQQHNLSINRFSIPSSLIELMFIDSSYFINYYYKIDDNTSNVNIQKGFSLTTYLDQKTPIYSSDDFVEVLNKSLLEGYSNLPSLTSEHKNDTLTASDLDKDFTVTATKLTGIDVRIVSLSYSDTHDINWYLKLVRNTEEILVYSGELGNATEIKFTETGQFHSDEIKFDGSSQNKTFRFRESTLNHLDNSNGTWTLKLETDSTDTPTSLSMNVIVTFNSLPTNLGVPNEAPYISKTADNQKFILNYNQNFNRKNIELSFSKKLHHIVSFPSTEKDIGGNLKAMRINWGKFVYNNTITNDIVHYTQPQNTVFKICNANMIEIRTESIPVRAELGTQSGTSTLLLTDFKIPSSIIDNTGYIIFNSQQKRLHAMTANFFKSYDIQIFITYNNSSPENSAKLLKLKPNDSVDVKLEIEQD